MLNSLNISKLEQKKILFLFVFSIVESVCSVFGLLQLAGIISTVFLYATFFWDRQIPLCIYIITLSLGTHLIGVVNTINAVYLSVLALNLIYRRINNPVYKKYIIITVYFFVILVISYNTGFNSRLDIAIKMVLACLIILQIASYGSQERSLIISAVLFSGIFMALIVMVSVLMGGGVDISNRLLFNENSKVLSTSVAPVVFSAVYLLFFGKEKNKVLYSIILFLLAAILSYLIVLTYSRGVLIALIISVIYLIIRYMGRLSAGSFVFLALLVFVAYYLLTKMKFDEEMMFRSLEGGNGRTEIWADFYQQLKDTNTMAFGFGPGLTKEISRLDYYSHSTILDYLFCYGITGFIYILYLLFSVTFNLFKTKSIYYQGLFLLNTIMFSTHGSAGTLLFNVILGLCMGVIVCDKNEAVVKKTIV